MSSLAPNHFITLFGNSHNHIKKTVRLVLIGLSCVLISCNSSKDSEAPADDVDSGDETVDLVGVELAYRNH